MALTLKIYKKKKKKIYSLDNKFMQNVSNDSFAEVNILQRVLFPKKPLTLNKNDKLNE